MKKAFKYHRSEKYTLIMTTEGEGICSVSLDEHIKSCACIYNLDVEETHRRKGYGNMLLEEAENEARRLGADVVSLAADKDTFMAGWYKRKGYRPVFSDGSYITLFKCMEK